MEAVVPVDNEPGRVEARGTESDFGPKNLLLPLNRLSDEQLSQPGILQVLFAA